MANVWIQIEIYKNLRKNFRIEKKKILIVGGTGFIGYHLAKKCLDKKFNVTSLSTKLPKKLRKLKK